MTRLSKVRLLAIACLVTSGCGHGATPPEKAARLTWETREVTRTLAGCSRDSLDCTYVHFVYPEIAAARSAAAKDSVHSYVRDLLVGGFVQAGDSSGVDSVATQMLQSFVASRRPIPGRTPPPLFEETVIRIAGDTLGVVTLDAHTNSYSGGAHPGHVTTLVMLDAVSGRRVRLSELFTDAGLDSVTRLAEAAFRAHREIPADASLDASRYWFEGGRFRLAENVALVRDGLEVYYNEYEVMSYADGPTLLVLPWSSLGGLVLPRTGR